MLVDLTDDTHTEQVGSFIAMNLHSNDPSMGDAPTTCVVGSGAPPPGVLFNPATGQLQGVPTQAGTFTFTYVCTDADGDSAMSLVTCVITPEPPPDPEPVPSPIAVGDCTARGVTDANGSVYIEVDGSQYFDLLGNPATPALPVA